MPLVDLGVDLCLEQDKNGRFYLGESSRSGSVPVSRPASQPQTVGGPTAPPTPAGRFAGGLTEVVGRASRLDRAAGPERGWRPS